MYAGSMLERGTVDEVLRSPRHPYTRMLLATVPSLRAEHRAQARWHPSAASCPDLATLRAGCPFAARCAYRRAPCAEMPVMLDAADDRHGSACPFV